MIPGLSELINFAVSYIMDPAVKQATDAVAGILALAAAVGFLGLLVP